MGSNLKEAKGQIERGKVFLEEQSENMPRKFKEEKKSSGSSRTTWWGIGRNNNSYSYLLKSQKEVKSEVYRHQITWAIVKIFILSKMLNYQRA